MNLLYIILIILLTALLINRIADIIKYQKSHNIQPKRKKRRPKGPRYTGLPWMGGKEIKDDY